MIIKRFDNTYFVYVFKKVFFIPAPHKYLRRIKWVIINAFFDVREDIDCDGSSLTYKDKITDGKIYFWHGWNYTRVGGTYGVHTVIFDRWIIRK